MEKLILNHDFNLDIATAPSRMAKRWKNKRCAWSDIVKRCQDTTYTAETPGEYTHMTKDEQSNVKDVGGFVGGFLAEGVRKTDAVKWRSMATLDIDYGTEDFWQTFTEKFRFAAMLYSTHKHSAKNPRYRLVFPFSRNVQPDEYEPVCRKIAETLGIDYFDDTTYQLARLFYWPSTSRGAEYVFRCQDGPACDVDAVLALYHDYRDASTWPVSDREGNIIRHSVKKAEDPTEKNGLIGAFCRTYGIEETIDKFLPDVYEKTAYNGRYTYKRGSVAAGLVCYDGKFAYSNHETDPASRQLCNAFDLCRIHLFGQEDEGSRVTEATRKPSYRKMLDFVAKDKKVGVLLAREKREEAQSDFAKITIKNTRTDDGWLGDLERDKSGAVKSNARNIIMILENDPGLKGRVWYNQFNRFNYVTGGLPWDKKAEIWTNNDEANLRVYLEQNYGVTGKDRISDAFTAVVTRNRVHPIRKYLDGLKWDGVPRLDRLVIDYIGAADNELTRIMTRKHFTAAVARVMKPGCKYDYCLIVAGPEGIGKSTLFSVMGGEWFSDSVITMDGTRGMEQAESGWVIELPELGSVKRTDVEQVKAFISKQVNTYRPAYARVMEQRPRQCVFCGTTNETYFLKGDTGNRRFWVIEADPSLRKYDNPKVALERDRDQLWAEAVERYKGGERLYLDGKLEMEARKRQQDFNDNNDDPLPGMVRDFLDMKLPPSWNTWDLNRRRAYLRNPDPLDEEATEERTRVCAAEFICEVLGMDISDSGYKYKARKTNQILENIGWTKWSALRFPLYGLQRCFVKEFNFGNNSNQSKNDNKDNI